VHRSPASAHASSGPGPTTDDAPIAGLEDPNVEVVTDKTYGLLGAGCERESHE